VVSFYQDFRVNGRENRRSCAVRSRPNKREGSGGRRDSSATAKIFRTGWLVFIST